MNNDNSNINSLYDAGFNSLLEKTSNIEINDGDKLLASDKIDLTILDKKTSQIVKTDKIIILSGTYDIPTQVSTAQKVFNHDLGYEPAFFAEWSTDDKVYHPIPYNRNYFSLGGFDGFYGINARVTANQFIVDVYANVTLVITYPIHIKYHILKEDLNEQFLS